MKYIVKKYPSKILMFMFLTVLLSILTVLNAVILQYITNAANLSNKKSYVVIVINVLAFICLQTLVYYFQQFYSQYLAKKSISLYRKIIFQKIINQDLAVISENEVSRWISLMTTQMDNLEENYFTAIYWGFYLLVQFIIACIVAVIINPTMAIFAVLLSIPNIFLPLLVKKKLEGAKAKVINKTDLYIARITDYLNGIIDWKVNNSEAIADQQEQLANNTLLKNQKSELEIQNKVTAVNKIFSDLLYFGTWLLGIYFVITKKLTLASVVAFAQLITNISYPIYSFSNIFTQLVGGNKLFKEIEDRFSTLSSRKSPAVNRELKFKKIAVNKVSVSFNNKKIIDNFSVDILSQKKYLLCGHSGSGKSTFVKLLIKQIKNYQGQILLNNIDIKDILDQNIYSLVGYLPQEGHVFSDSLRDNLTLYNNDISDQRIVEVLRFVELGKWANKKKLDEKIIKEKISGGEAKRIELARLLLQKKPILILDEFSSGIDKTTLKSIENKLFKLPITLIYITHVYDKDLIDKTDEVVEF